MEHNIKMVRHKKTGHVWILMSCLCLAQHFIFILLRVTSTCNLLTITPPHPHKIQQSSPTIDKSTHGTGCTHTFYCMAHLCITCIPKIALFTNGLTHFCCL